MNIIWFFINYNFNICFDRVASVFSKLRVDFWVVINFIKAENTWDHTDWSHVSSTEDAAFNNYWWSRWRCGSVCFTSYVDISATRDYCSRSISSAEDISRSPIIIFFRIRLDNWVQDYDIGSRAIVAFGYCRIFLFTISIYSDCYAHWSYKCISASSENAASNSWCRCNLFSIRGSLFTHDDNVCVSDSTWKNVICCSSSSTEDCSFYERSVYCYAWIFSCKVSEDFISNRFVNEVSYNTKVSSAVDVSADMCVRYSYRRCVCNCSIDDDV